MADNKMSDLKEFYARNKGLLHTAAALGVMSTILGHEPRKEDAYRYTHDIDVGVLDPESLRELAKREKEREDSDRPGGIQTKSAQLKIFDDPDLNTGATYALAAMVPVLGFEAGRRLGSGVSDRDEENIEEARKNFEKALMREQLAAMRAGRGNDLQPLMPKQAQEDDDAWIRENSQIGKMLGPLGFLAQPYMAYAGPAAALSSLIGYHYFKKQNPARKEYNRAKETVERRLGAQIPRARLVGPDEPLDEEEAKERRNRQREMLEEIMEEE